MKIICAGMPKTGTKSMALALRQLGYTVFDFLDIADSSEYFDAYLDFLQGSTSEGPLMDLYRDIDALTDQPGSMLWLNFRQNFPDAKVILMERESPEVWFDSYLKMIKYYKDHHLVWYENIIRYFSHSRAKFEDLEAYLYARTFGHSLNPKQRNFTASPESWKNMYIMHGAAVRQLVPSSHLLVFRTGEGWENLCRFLDKEVPKTPFPRENVGGAKGNIQDQSQESRILRMARQEFRWNLFLLGTVITAAAVGVVSLF